MQEATMNEPLRNHFELLAAFRQGMRITAVAPTNRYVPAIEFEVLHVDEVKVALRSAWGGKVQVGANSAGLRYYAVGVRGVQSITPKERGWFHKASTWYRSTFCSVWQCASLELIVVQCSGSDESWKWTARGARQPSEADGADAEGWVQATTRKLAEQAALKWYLAKD